MSGMLVTVIPPTLYDFLNLDVSQSMSFIVASRIDTTGVEAGVLQVRVHSVNIAQAADSIAVEVSTHGYSPDDPGTDFGAVGATMASTSFPGQSVSPLFTTNALLGNFGGLVKIAVKATRSVVGATALQAKLSIDLVMKTGGAARSAMARLPGTFLGYR